MFQGWCYRGAMVSLMSLTFRAIFNTVGKYDTRYVLFVSGAAKSHYYEITINDNVTELTQYYILNNQNILKSLIG